MTSALEIGVVANAGKPLAKRVLLRLADCASRRGIALLADATTAAAAGPGWPWPPQEPVAFARAKAVIAIGGDGTLLRTLHSLGKTDAPVLGLNIGSLGYLSGAGEGQVDDALAAIANGTVEISERPMLAAAISRDGGAAMPVGRDALNEVVILRGSGRMVRVAMALDGIPVTTYACDGIIVSTPTGSTAYSLSAGGPLVMPGTAASVITIICPHALSSRPLVVPADARVALRPVQGEAPLVVAVDGEDTATLHCGDTLEIVRSGRTAKIAFLPGHSNYLALSRKLGWAGASSPLP